MNHGSTNRLELFSVCNFPTKPQIRNYGLYEKVLNKCKKLPAEKVVVIKPKNIGVTYQGIRCALAQAATRRGMKVIIKVLNGNVYVWERRK